MLKKGGRGVTSEFEEIARKLGLMKKNILEISFIFRPPSRHQKLKASINVYLIFLLGNDHI